MNQQKFWMVVGLGVPYYKHTTEHSAATEAERLASLNPGEEFTVLESVASVKKSDMRWVTHEDVRDPSGSGDVPF